MRHEYLPCGSERVPLHRDRPAPHPVTTEIGYAAGRLRAAAVTTRRKSRDLTVDAAVAATALSLPGPTIVLTSDPDDLQRLLSGTPVRVEQIG